MKTPINKPVAGGAILIVLLIVVVATVLVGSAVYFSTSQNRMAARQRESLESMAAADGALEYTYAVWRDIIRNAGSKAPTAKALKDDKRIKDLWDNKTNKSPAVELAATGNTLSDFSIKPTDPWGQPPDDEDAEPVKYEVAVDNFPGWMGQANFYKATVKATGPKTLVGAKNVDAFVSRYFTMTAVPLFQAAIFYMGDLELHPGALMTIKGLVHSNASIYASSYAKLQFLDNVSYGIDFHERSSGIGDWTGQGGGGSTPSMTPFWSDDLQTGTSTARARQLHGPLDRLEPFGASPQALFDPNDLNQNNDGYHEWIEPPALLGGADPAEIAEQRLYNKADLRIQVNSSLLATDLNRIKITDGTGKKLKKADEDLVKAAIEVGTPIYDWREGGGIAGAPSGAVKVTSLDMKVMNTALTELKKTKFNGVMYVNDVALGKDAIRLKNGASLAMDLTVASENPVYIQGDYNTGTGTGAKHDPNLVPSNNGGNPTGTDSPIVPGYAKKSAAVIADAVVVLSNNWDDANSTKTLSGRVATPTTVNAAFMAGDVPTNYNNNGTASGGAHNFPRFLESWHNSSTRQYVDLTYYGSMVEAFNSKTFTGAWSTGNVYMWPNRRWNFEPQFSSNPPPGTVAGTLYSRGRWERM